MIPELAYEALVCRDKLRSHWQRRLVLDVARIKQIFAAWAQKKKHGEEPTVRASRGREAARGDAAVELAVVALAVAAQARRLARLPRVEPHRPRRRTWRRQRATTTNDDDDDDASDAGAAVEHAPATDASRRSGCSRSGSYSEHIAAVLHADRDEGGDDDDREHVRFESKIQRCWRWNVPRAASHAPESVLRSVKALRLVVFTATAIAIAIEGAVDLRPSVRLSWISLNKTWARCYQCSAAACSLRPAAVGAFC